MSRERRQERRERERQRQQREHRAGPLPTTRESVRIVLSTSNDRTLNAAIAAAMQIPPELLECTPPPPPPPPPVFSECVIGYREWLVDALGQLRAVTMTKQAWLPGINTARCRPADHCSPSWSWIPDLVPEPESHPAPASGCQCGLYGWNDLQTADPEARIARGNDVDAAGRLYALGAIAAWGDLLVHEKGFRASHACVVALAYGDETTARVHRTLGRVAGEYGVPLVHVDTLQAEAEQHGTPLPAHVRPRRGPFITIDPLLLLPQSHMFSVKTIRGLTGT